ncbi:MAG: ROK family protein [Pyrinomonadaceae bacterium]|nr:ROK family protein [Pyrinomonadaceae bacterium]MDQ3135889.1 ROK family protein [Acidobacteriota bacterium]
MMTQTESSNYIGVDLSGAALRAALVTNEGRVVERREAALSAGDIATQVTRVAADLRGEASRVFALGVGVPGLVNPETGRVIISSDLPAIVRSDLQTEIAQASGLNVTMENDANAAAYGEYIAGAGHGSRHMFYVTIGNGIGGALILDSKLWLGDSGFAGEFGHITIDPEGIECTCGNVGCLETVASAPNIVRRTHERLMRDSTSSLSRLGLNKNFTASDIAHAANDGDDFALMMLERTGRYIGTAIAAVINLLNIERIVLGGRIMEAGDLILNPIIREAGRRSFQPCFEATQIVAAALGPDAVPIGAAMLARDMSGAAH